MHGCEPRCPIGSLGGKCSWYVTVFRIHLKGSFPSQGSCHLPPDCSFDESPRTDNEDVVTRVLHLITIKDRHLLWCSLYIRLRA